MSTISGTTIATVKNNIDLLARFNPEQNFYCRDNYFYCSDYFGSKVGAFFKYLIPITQEDLAWTMDRVKEIKEKKLNREDQKQIELLELSGKIEALEPLLLIGLRGLAAKIQLDAETFVGKYFTDSQVAAQENTELYASIMNGVNVNDILPPLMPPPPPLPDLKMLLPKVLNLSFGQRKIREETPPPKTVQEELKRLLRGDRDENIKPSAFIEKSSKREEISVKEKEKSSLEKRIENIREQVQDSSDDESAPWDPNASYLSQTGEEVYQTKQ